MWQHCLSTAYVNSLTCTKFDWQAYVYKGSGVILCLEGACSRRQLQGGKVLQGCLFVDGWAPDCGAPEVCVMGEGVHAGCVPWDCNCSSVIGTVGCGVLLPPWWVHF
jgi:hypothetical protein